MHRPEPAGLLQHPPDQHHCVVAAEKGLLVGSVGAYLAVATSVTPPMGFPGERDGQEQLVLWQGLEIQASTESRASPWLTGWGNGSPLPFWPPALILQWKTMQRDDGAEGFAGGLLPCPSCAKVHRGK